MSRGVGFSKSISGFDPRTIAGCQLWLDATDTSSRTGSSPVTAWRDKSVSVNSTTSVTGTPVFTTNAINGREAILFSGSSSFTGSITGSGTTLTVCIVGTQSNTCAINGGLVCLGRSGQYDWADAGSLAITQFQPLGSGLMLSTRNGVNSQTTNTGGTGLVNGSTASPFVYILVFDETYVNTFLNGTQQTTANISSSGTFAYTNYVIGGRAGSSTNVFYTGYIGEVLVYQSSLTTSQRQQVEGYLAWKWGIQTISTRKLIGGHSFYYLRPQTRIFQPSDILTPLFWWDAADTKTITGTSSVTAWLNKGSWSGSATSYSGTVVSGSTKYNGLNVVVFSTNGELRFTAAIPLQPRAWFAVFKQTTQVTVSGPNNTQYFAIVNQTQGNSQDSPFGPGTPTTQGTSTCVLVEGPSGVQGNVATANIVPDGYNVMKQYGWINSAVSTASNYQTVNGRDYIAGQSPTANVTASGSGNYRTDSVTYSINTGWYNNSCHCAEILMFNTEITISQRQQIEGYLANKWGLETSLVSGHPYIKLPPSSPIPFLPTNFSGCVLWLDGNDPLGTGLIPINNATIAAWIDKSTNNVSSTVTGTLTYQSSFANNNGSVKFSGTQYIQNTTFTLSLSVKTFFMVCSSYAATTNGSPAGYIYFGNVGNVYDQQNGTAYQGPEGGFNNKFGFLQGYGNGGYYTSVTIAGETPLGIYGDTQSSTTASLYVNGGVLATNTLSYTPGLATGFRIGKRSDNLGGSAYNLYGNICEIIVYNVVLSTAQRQKVEGYLACKWGLTSSLISTHPYKLYEPSQEGFLIVSAPDTPTGLTASNTTSTFNMSWTTGSGGTPVTFTVTVYEGVTLVATQTISYPTTSTTFSPMTSGVAYTFYVSATNTTGTSAIAGPSSPSVTYTAPATTVITTVGAGSVSFGTGSQIIIECWGGGGGSMGNDVYTGAGAGGAYAKTTLTGLTAAFTLYYSVGAGGTGGQSSASAGGSTWARITTNAQPTVNTQGALAVGGNGSGVAGPNNSTQSASSIGQTIYIGGAGGYNGPENGGGGSASSGGNGTSASGGQGTAGGASGTGGGAGGSAGGTANSGGDGISNVEGGGGGGGSYNNQGGNGGLPGGAGGMGWSTGGTPTSGTNTNPHGFGGNGGRGQIRYARS